MTATIQIGAALLKYKEGKVYSRFKVLLLQLYLLKAIASYKLRYKFLLLQCLPKPSGSYSTKLWCYSAYQNVVEAAQQSSAATINAYQKKVEATLQSSTATMLTISKWKLHYKVLLLQCLPKTSGSYTTKFCCYNAYQNQVEATLQSSAATMLTKNKWKLHYKVLLLQCLPKAGGSYATKFTAYQKQVEATLQSSAATMLTKTKRKLRYKVLLLQCLPKLSGSLRPILRGKWKPNSSCRVHALERLNLVHKFVKFQASTG